VVPVEHEALAAPEEDRVRPVAHDGPGDEEVHEAVPVQVASRHGGRAGGLRPCRAFTISLAGQSKQLLLML
jgi:hypothetical protein